MASKRTERDQADLDLLQQAALDIDGATLRFEAHLLAASVGGWTNHELGQALGVSGPTVSRWLKAIEAKRTLGAKVA